MSKLGDSPAFARPCVPEDEYGGPAIVGQRGMSVRVYLVGQALAGLSGYVPAHSFEAPPDKRAEVEDRKMKDVSRLAVQLADATLAALETQ